MSQQTQKPNQDLLNTQMNADVDQNKEHFSNEEIIKRELIPLSPFVKITLYDKSMFIAMGDNRLTDIYESNEELEKYMETWEFKTVFVNCVIEMREKYLESQKN